MKEKKISIIVPAYNAEDKIERCIESVIDQTYNNFELIIIDDGSKDATKEICERYSKTDKRIKVFTKENGGVSTARNYGIEKAGGEYLCFIDCDDSISNDCLQTLIDNLQNFDLAIATYKNIYSIKDLIDTANHQASNYKLKLFDQTVFFKDHIKNILNSNMPVRNIFAKLYRTQIIKQNNLKFNDKIFIGEDSLFLLQYIKNCKNQIVYIEKPVYNYFQNINSLTKKFQPDMFNQFKILMQQIKNVYAEEFDDIENLYKNFYISNIFSTLKNILTFYKGKELKIKIKEILNSDQVDYSLQNLKPINKKIKICSLLLKLKSVFLIKIFYKLYSLKKAKYFKD